VAGQEHQPGVARVGSWLFSRRIYTASEQRAMSRTAIHDGSARLPGHARPPQLPANLTSSTHADAFLHHDRKTKARSRTNSAKRSATASMDANDASPDAIEQFAQQGRRSKNLPTPRIARPELFGIGPARTMGVSARVCQIDGQAHRRDRFIRNV